MYYRINGIEQNRIEYIRVDSAVTLAPLLFLIFGLALYLSSQHPHTLNKVQYLADGDVGKVNVV